jgi:hypothetical protein
LKQLTVKEVEKLCPAQQILEAYKETNGEFEHEKTVHDRFFDIWYSKISENEKQPIYLRIDSISREKVKDKEYLFGHCTYIGKDWLGNQKTFDHIYGKIDHIPIWEREANIDPETHSMKPTYKISGVMDHRTEYTIPFSKEKAEELLESARENIQFVVHGGNNRKYSCTKEQFLNDSIEDIVESHTKFKAVSEATRAAEQAYEKEKDRVSKLGISR